MSQFNPPFNPGDLGDGSSGTGEPAGAGLGGGPGGGGGEPGVRFLFLDQGQGRKRLVVKDGRALTTKDGAPCCCETFICDPWEACSRIQVTRREIIRDSNTGVTVQINTFELDAYLQTASNEVGDTRQESYRGTQRLTIQPGGQVILSSAQVFRIIAINQPANLGQGFFRDESNGCPDNNSGAVMQFDLFGGSFLYGVTLHADGEATWSFGGNVSADCSVVPSVTCESSTGFQSIPEPDNPGTTYQVVFDQITCTPVLEPGGNLIGTGHQIVWPTPDPCDTPPPPVVQGFIGINNHGQRVSIPSGANWNTPSRNESEGPPDGTGAISEILGTQLNATDYYIGAPTFENQLPAGATIDGVRLDVWWRQRRSTGGTDANRLILQDLRLYTFAGGPVLGSERQEIPIELPVAGVFPNNNAPWTQTTYGPDLWGMPQSFWDDPSTISAINNNSFGFEFWFRSSFTAPATHSYFCELDAAFMVVDYTPLGGTPQTLTAPVNLAPDGIRDQMRRRCRGCGDEGLEDLL